MSILQSGMSENGTIRITMIKTWSVISFFACGALAASICVGIVIPSTWLSIYLTYCKHNGRV